MSQSLYRDLKVWQKGIDLVVAVYGITASFPRSEQFGITAQMRRAAVSIPCNIAEGKGRKSQGAFANHLWIARGSMNEVETLSEISTRLGMLDKAADDAVHSACEEISRMLVALGRRIERTSY